MTRRDHLTALFEALLCGLMVGVLFDLFMLVLDVL
jgi:hypothetical protein